VHYGDKIATMQKEREESIMCCGRGQPEVSAAHKFAPREKIEALSFSDTNSHQREAIILFEWSTRAGISTFQSPPYHISFTT
jgi:hypothetical protein